MSSCNKLNTNSYSLPELDDQARSANAKNAADFTYGEASPEIRSQSVDDQRQLLAYMRQQNTAIMDSPEQAEDSLVSPEFQEALEALSEEEIANLQQLLALLEDGDDAALNEFLFEKIEADDTSGISDQSSGSFHESVQLPGHLQQEESKSEKVAPKKSRSLRGWLKGALAGIGMGAMVATSAMAAPAAAPKPAAAATKTPSKPKKTLKPIFRLKTKNVRLIMFVRDALLPLSAKVKAKAKNQKITLDKALGYLDAVLKNDKKKIEDIASDFGGKDKLLKAIDAILQSVGNAKTGLNAVATGIDDENQAKLIVLIKHMQPVFKALIETKLKGICKFDNPTLKVVDDNQKLIDDYFKILTEKSTLDGEADSKRQSFVSYFRKFKAAKKAAKELNKLADTKKGNEKKKLQEQAKAASVAAKTNLKLALKYKKEAQVEADKAGEVVKKLNPAMVKLYKALADQYENIEGTCSEFNSNGESTKKIRENVAQLAAFLSKVEKGQVADYLKKAWYAESGNKGIDSDNLLEVLYIAAAKELLDPDMQPALDQISKKVGSSFKGYIVIKKQSGKRMIAKSLGNGKAETEPGKTVDLHKDWVLYAVPPQMQAAFKNPNIYDAISGTDHGNRITGELGAYARFAVNTRHYDTPSGPNPGQRVNEAGGGITLGVNGTATIVKGATSADRNPLMFKGRLAAEIGGMRRFVANIMNPQAPYSESSHLDLRFVAEAGFSFYDWATVSFLAKFDPLNLAGEFGGQVSLQLAYVTIYAYYLGYVGQGGHNVLPSAPWIKSNGVNGHVVGFGAKTEW